MTRIAVPKMPATPKRARFNPDRAEPTELLGVENPGSSKRGNTHWSRMRKCPREHALFNLVKLRRKGDSEALTVGLSFHLALETYYRAVQEHQRDLPLPGAGPAEAWDHFFWGNALEAERAAWESIDGLRGVADYEETWAELQTMLAGYFDNYRRKDRWRVIAVEESLEYSDDGMEYTARLDLIVECFDRKGMWVVEHKSARTITPDLMAGYQLDQQILGQVWLLRACVDLSVYPALRGVLVNLTSKHKRGPECVRVECMPSKYHLAAFETSLRAWNDIGGYFEAAGWPQALGNCAGPSRYWSQCDYYDVCYGQPHRTVEQLLNTDPPPGFYRPEET